MCPKKHVEFSRLLTLRLEEWMRVRLEEMAKEERRPIGNMARLVLEEGIKARDAAKGKGKGKK